LRHVEVVGSDEAFESLTVTRSNDMKKQTTKKLALLTQTVRNLVPEDLGRVAGGKTTAITCTCPTSQLCTNGTECL
jgi:hypothetical protein